MPSVILPCEPNLSLPQEIDIDALRREAKLSAQPTTKTCNIPLKDVDDDVLFAPTALVVNNVMPIEKREYDKLNEILSAKKNEYIKCRWNNFLEKIPDNHVVIISYEEFIK